jgi:hypothetical protein
MHSKWMMGQWMQSEGANRSEQRFAPALDNRVPPICAKIYHIRQIGLRKEVAQVPFLIAILREAAAKRHPILSLLDAVCSGTPITPRISMQ